MREIHIKRDEKLTVERKTVCKMERICEEKYIRKMKREHTV